MSNVLVVVLCETRCFELTGELFMKNMLNVVHGDLCLCVREEETTDNIFYRNAKYIFTEKEERYFDDKFNLVKEKEKSIEDWKELVNYGNMWLGGLNTDKQHGSSAILYYYRWVLLNKLKENNLIDKYDWFIVTRSDFMWEIQHPLIEFLDDNKIYIPYGEDYGGYTDRHIIVPRKYLIQTLDLITPIINEPKTIIKEVFNNKFDGNNLFNTEQYIKYILQKRGIEKHIKVFPYVMYCVRKSRGTTRWNLGQWNNERGFYIKYIYEYASFKYFKNYIKTQDDWKKYL